MISEQGSPTHKASEIKINPSTLPEIIGAKGRRDSIFEDFVNHISVFIILRDPSGVVH
jgi:hypothetical protein